MEDEKMGYAQGTVTASDIATLGLVAGGGGYGGGYGINRGGYGGGGFLASEALANGTATKEAINANADLIRMQGESFENINRQNQFFQLDRRNSDGIQRICDQLHASELNNQRENADLSRQLAECCCNNQKGLLEMQLKNQECCCETQKLVTAENAATRQLILENDIKRTTDANNINATVSGIVTPLVGAINAGNAAILLAIGNIDNGGGWPGGKAAV